MQDFSNPAWTVVCAEIDNQLKLLQKKLVDDLDLDKTNQVRGGIRALQALRDLPTRAARTASMKASLAQDEPYL